MTLAELRAWATDPAQETDSMAAAIRAVLRELDEQRKHSARLANLVPEYEQMKTDLAIAVSGLKSYEKELARLRSVQTRSPWD